MRPSMVEHQPFTIFFIFYYRTMAWTLPAFYSHWTSSFQNGIIWIFGIWSQGIIRFGDSHSITVIIIATPTVKQIINTCFFHKPLSFNNATLPSLIIFHYQNGITSGSHSCWIKQNCPKLSGVAVSISIYFIYQIVVHSLPKYCCVYQSFRGIRYQRSSFIDIRTQNIVRYCCTNAQFVRFIFGCVISHKFAVYIVYLWCPITAASSPRRWRRKNPANLCKIDTCRTFPDGEIVPIPSHCGYCIILSVGVDNSWVRRITIPLHWVSIVQDQSKAEAEKNNLFSYWRHIKILIHTYVPIFKRNL